MKKLNNINKFLIDEIKDFSFCPRFWNRNNISKYYLKKSNRLFLSNFKYKKNFLLRIFAILCIFLGLIIFFYRG
jgi:hypothetical protein